MAERQIYLVRHGQIQLPGPAKHFIGQLDLPLDSTGIEQAHNLARRLSQVRFDAVIGSDLQRSRQTAAIIGDFFSLQPQVCSDLREINMGNWEGLAFAEVSQKFPGEFEQRGQDIAGFRPPGGESFQDCSRRVIAAWNDILNSTRGDLLIAGHAGVNRVILCHLLGMPLAHLFRLGQDYGCFNLVRLGPLDYYLQKLNEVPQEAIR